MSRIAVLGLGLIGGSLLRRLDRAATGHDIDPDTRSLARAAGLTVVDTAAAAVAVADVVVLAVPLSALSAVVEQVRPALPPTAVLTDVGSVKAPPYDVLRRLGLAGRFVGGHPMAGTERSGFAASDPALFDGAAWVLCLEPDTELDQWLAVARLCTGLGARVVPATAAEHDAAVARISHLPHLLAAAVAVGAAETGRLALALAAGSFADLTRVAAGRPELTAAMCTANRVQVEAAVAELRNRLEAEAGSWPELIEAGHVARQRWQGLPSPPMVRASAVCQDELMPDLLALGRAGGWVDAVEGGFLSVAGPAEICDAAGWSPTTAPG